MALLTSLLTTRHIAQVVRPYDPETMPLPVPPAADSNSWLPYFGTALAALAVLVSALLIRRRTRRHSR